MRISKTFEFDAAHHLPNYKGRCANNNGHHFLVEVVFIGDKNPETQMVVDFHWIKIQGESILGIFDHTDLNDLFQMPTAENIAAYIYKLWMTVMPPNLILQEVNLWEQPTSKVSYTHFDWEACKGEPKIDS